MAITNLIIIRIMAIEKISKIRTKKYYLCTDWIETHNQKYDENYACLDALDHGPVQLVWFCEPTNSYEYVLYTTKWWKTDCKAESHGRNLFDAHYDAFINPETRFVKMIFYLNIVP